MKRCHRGTRFPAAKRIFSQTWSFYLHFCGIVKNGNTTWAKEKHHRAVPKHTAQDEKLGGNLHHAAAINEHCHQTPPKTAVAQKTAGL